MKKIKVTIGLILLISALMFCTKSIEFIPVESSNPNLIQEGQQSCSCSYSGFWNSCSITCPVVDGVCLAHCGGGSVGIWPFTITVATCACGSAGAGSNNASSAGAFISEENLLNLESSKVVLQNYSGSDVNSAINSINILISFYGTTNHSEEIAPLIREIISLIDSMDEDVRQDLANLL